VQYLCSLACHLASSSSAHCFVWMAKVMCILQIASMTSDLHQSPNASCRPHAECKEWCYIRVHDEQGMSCSHGAASRLEAQNDFRSHADDPNSQTDAPKLHKDEGTACSAWRHILGHFFDVLGFQGLHFFLSRLKLLLGVSQVIACLSGLVSPASTAVAQQGYQFTCKTLLQACNRKVRGSLVQEPKGLCTVILRTSMACMKSRGRTIGEWCLNNPLLQFLLAWPAGHTSAEIGASKLGNHVCCGA